MLVNVDGEAFMHPLETRDVSAASIILCECSDDRNEGVETPTGARAVWLDTPMIELIHGEGTIEKSRLCSYVHAVWHRYEKEPIWFTRRCIIRTVDWKCNGEGTNTVSNLLVAGEAVGGDPRKKPSDG